MINFFLCYHLACLLNLYLIILYFFNNVVVFAQELPICSKPIVLCVAELHNRILAQNTAKYSILVY